MLKIQYWEKLGHAQARASSKSEPAQSPSQLKAPQNQASSSCSIIKPYSKPNLQKLCRTSLLNESQWLSSFEWVRPLLSIDKGSRWEVPPPPPLPILLVSWKTFKLSNCFLGLIVALIGHNSLALPCWLISSLAQPSADFIWTFVPLRFLSKLSILSCQKQIIVTDNTR